MHAYYISLSAILYFKHFSKLLKITITFSVITICSQVETINGLMYHLYPLKLYVDN